MTDVTSFADSGPVQDGDYGWVARGGVGYKVLGTRLVRTDALGDTRHPGAISAAGHGSNAPGNNVQFGYSGTLGPFVRAFNGTLGSHLDLNYYAAQHIFSTASGEKARLTAAGLLLVGTATDYGLGAHFIQRGSSENDLLLGIGGASHACVRFHSAGTSTWNAAAAAFRVAANSTTGRSINAAGTINASGADTAEYVLKSAGCGEIAKGQVAGITAAGELTLSWAASHSHVLKSTDPHLAGGDRWDREVGPEPVGPAALRAEPMAPAAPAAFSEPKPQMNIVDGSVAEDETAEAFLARLEDWGVRATAAAQAQAKHTEEMAAFVTDHAAWADERAAFDAAMTEYEAALPVWQAAHEAARQKVDRVAFSGLVQVIVTGEFAPGDYLIAAEGPGDTIVAVAVADADITFDQYRKRLGKVWAVTEDDPDGRWPAGRAWVDVQHG